MNTEVLRAEDKGSVRRAVAILESGGVVAFPTDTVYGVGASPWDEDAVRRLYQVKERPLDLPIPLLLSDDEVLDLVAVLPKSCRELPGEFWPGGLTLVVPKTDAVCDTVSPRPTVAVRIPDNALARTVIREAGGVLAVTSANLSGHPSPRTAEDVESQLGGRIPLIIDGGPSPIGVASTILDCSVTPPRLLRRGAVSEANLRAVVGALDTA
jgi:L-threonylcarbamoyladenylate synthase